MNPDNLATPLAASIGDVVSLSVLSIFARNLFTIHGNLVVWFFVQNVTSNFLATYTWVLYLISGVYILCLLPFWIFIVLKNKYTKTILTHGWVPVLSALFISG